jgi:CheY-like chemotaxis protein
MEDDKKHHILHIEDSEVNIHSFQLIAKKYSRIIVTVMSLLNEENDGSKGGIDIKKPIFFRDKQDKIGISIQDILTNKFHFSLILIDRNMQNSSNTDAIVKLFKFKKIKIPIIGISSDIVAQSQICDIECIEKPRLDEQFEEEIYNKFINIA